MRRRLSVPRTVRLGLLALAVPKGVIATWVIVAPASFYRGFPGFGRQWVSLLPPYNEHLLTDFGGALLALAGMLTLAALALERRLVQTVLVAVLLQGLPHSGYHLKTFEALPLLDAVANLLAVSLGPALAFLLLVLSRQLDSSDHQRPIDTSTPPARGKSGVAPRERQAESSLDLMRC